MRAVHQVMQRAIEARHFQSATLLVADDGQPVIHQAYGRGRIDTVYDLASLTKPLATVAVLMQLVADGKVSIDARLGELLRATANSPIGKLPLWQLLCHCSGLPAWMPFYEQVAELSPSQRRGRVRNLVASTELAYDSGRKTVYSDLGFILLDWVIERLGRARLNKQAAKKIYDPLGLTRTRFIELARADARRELLRRWHFAPTERCSWRERRLIAEVHDDNCHAMGGVSGHAGLFSTAYEVHQLVRELVAAYEGRRSIFNAKIVQRFFDFQSPAPGGRWALGWDRPSETGASAGKHFSRRSIGHLGFTGASVWIDLDARLWVVLLTNRVYYGREPNPMKRFRPRLHDHVYRALRP